MSQTEEIKSSFPSDCKLAFGSSDKKQHTNLIKWTEDLEIHGKSKYGMFATIFRTKNVPEEWTTDYTPNARDRELAKDDEFLKKKIFLAMDERSKLMADWKSVQPKLSSYLISALTEASVSAIQEKERLVWTNSVQTDDIVAMMKVIVRCVTSTGKTSNFADIQLAKKRCDDLRLEKSESIAAFNQRLYLAETELERIGGKKKDNAERVFDLLIQLTDYPNMAVKLRVTEILARAGKEDFPTDRDAVIEELLTLESVSKIIDTHKKDTNKLQPSVNTTTVNTGKAQLLTFADGSVGMQRGDGTYEVFLTDANGKLIGNKRMKGNKKKGMIKLKTIDEKTASAHVKTATEKYIEKLVGKYSITAQEAKQRFQCRHCNKNGHLETDCRLKKAEKTRKDDSSKKSESHKEKDSDKKVPEKTGSIYTTMTSLNLANAETDSDEDNFQVGLYMTNVFSAEEWYDTDVTAAFMSSEEEYMHESRMNFCLDSMANVSVANNKDLLINVRKLDKPIRVKGFGGIFKVLTETGTHPLFGDMLIDEGNPHNILSLDKAQSMGFKEITSKDQKRKILNHPEKGYCLVLHKDERDRFYKIHANAVESTLRSVYSTSLQRYYDDAYVYNAAHFYTMEQQQRAQEAIRLHQAFNHPSDKALSTLLVSPSAINIKVTPADLANARAIYGPCRHCLEGKAYPHVGSHKSWDPGNEPKEPGQLLHIDIVFINNRPRLFAVDHVTSYLSLVLMESKKHEELCKALDMVVAFYKSNLKVVRVLSSDSESVLKSDAINLYMNEKHGIKMSLRIPYEHEKTAERYMRMVREKMEAKLSELPYTLPPVLYDELALDVVKNCNEMPNAHTTPRTPREMVTGEKFNFLTDLIAPFGAPIMVIGGDRTKNQNPSNSIGICLGDDPRTKGGVKTMFPHDAQPVIRRGLRGMDFTKEWIDYMNDWAMRKPVKPGGGLFVFKETMQYSEDGITGDKSEITRAVDDAMLSLEDNRSRLSTDTIEPAHTDDAPVVDQPSTPPIVPTVSPPVNDAPPIAIDPVPAVTIDPPVAPIKAVRVSKPKPATPPTNDPVRRSARQSSANYKHAAISIPPSDIHFIQACQVYLTQLDEQRATDYMVYAAESMTWHEAMKTHFVKEAEAAAYKEIKNLIDLTSWRYLMHLSDRKPSIHEKVTTPSMLLKPKYDAKGVFLLWKGRLVSGGHRTDPRVYDPFEKHSPTIPLEVAKLQLGIASKTNADVETFDIPTAYLNAFLHEDKLQVMRMPKYLADLIIKVDPKAKKYLQPDGSLLVEVLRALYGFPESAKLWNEHLTSALIKGGYKQCPVEPCLFRKAIGDNKWSIITVYVDDCMHIYKGGPDVRKGLYDALHKANIPQPTIQMLTNEQDVSYLGMNISRKGNIITLSQPGYIKAILEKYAPTKKYVTPCTEDLFNRPASEMTSPYINITQYLSLLMKLMFLATRTRPDILTAVCGLATKCKAPTDADQKRVDRVVGYLANTIDLKLKCHVKDLVLHAYFDASWACHPDLKGHSGILITLGHYGFPIFCKSQKHKVVTRSSTEAELVCLYAGIDILLYIRRIGSFLGIKVDEPVTVHQDNTSAITMAYLGKGSSGSNSKFMDLKYFWIKQQLDAKLIKLQYLSTDQMTADFFASPRIGTTFRTLRDYIMGNYL